jgi:hypothetical protein
MLPLEIPVVEVSHCENGYRSRCTKPSRNVVTGDYVRLLAGWEGEDGNPCGEDISERVHLNGIISYRLTKARRKVALTIAEMYARFSGSCLFTSFTQVHVMPAHVPARAVRSEERRKSVLILMFLSGDAYSRGSIVMLCLKDGQV